MKPGIIASTLPGRLAESLAGFKPGVRPLEPCAPALFKLVLDNKRVANDGAMVGRVEPSFADLVVSNPPFRRPVLCNIVKGKSS